MQHTNFSFLQKFTWFLYFHCWCKYISPPPGFNGVRVAWSLVFCVMFCRSLFCNFSFTHCSICPSSVYSFWLPLWYLQTFLKRVIPPLDGIPELFLHFVISSSISPLRDIPGLFLHLGTFQSFYDAIYVDQIFYFANWKQFAQYIFVLFVV